MEQKLQRKSRIAKVHLAALSPIILKTNLKNVEKSLNTFNHFSIVSSLSANHIAI